MREQETNMEVIRRVSKILKDKGINHNMTFCFTEGEGTVVGGANHINTGAGNIMKMVMQSTKDIGEISETVMKTISQMQGTF